MLTHQLVHHVLVVLTRKERVKLVDIQEIQLLHRREHARQLLTRQLVHYVLVVLTRGETVQLVDTRKIGLLKGMVWSGTTQYPRDTLSKGCNI
jgi:hypothetical protein